MGEPVEGERRFDLQRVGLLKVWLPPLVTRETVLRGWNHAPQVPGEFKRDVNAVARKNHLSVAEVAADFDLSTKTIYRWMGRADIDDNVKDGLITMAWIRRGASAEVLLSLPRVSHRRHIPLLRGTSDHPRVSPDADWLHHQACDFVVDWNRRRRDRPSLPSSRSCGSGDRR